MQTPDGNMVFISTGGYPEYSYGQEISISGSLQYKLLNKSQIMTMAFPKISLSPDNGNKYLAVVNLLRQKIITVFQANLPKDSSSLLLGIVFGVKQEFSKNFSQSMKQVGIMHVIAASGMNITMAGGFIFFLFASLLRRRIAIVFSILGILFYASLAGFQPSIIRASIMGIIAYSAQILGRQQYSFYSLLLTAFIMLVLWPQFILDIGFQLSFASTLGILYIPVIIRLPRSVVFEDFLTSFSAQVATLPILLSNFGTYSLWSIIVNVLVLWTVPVLMILGAASAIVSFVFEPLAKLILFITLPFLMYFQAVAVFFSGLKGSIIIETFSWQFTVAYYLLLASVIIFALKRHE